MIHNLIENGPLSASNLPIAKLMDTLSTEQAQRVLFPAPLAPDLSTSMFGYKISAGFPSPADDYVEDKLDLNQLLIHNKAATFFLRVKGDSMINAGIHDGDIIVVDRSITPTDGAVVVAVVDGELTVKRLKFDCNIPELHAENPMYAPICFKKGQEMMIWGVVTSAVHAVK